MIGIKEKSGWPERIFICSPLRPRSKDPGEAEKEIEANLNRARKACKFVSDLGAIPYAPHIYATQFLDDGVPEERERGMELGREWLRIADEVWVFSERTSEGMASEIALASKLDIPVRMVAEPNGLMRRIIDDHSEMNALSEGKESKERKERRRR